MIGGYFKFTLDGSKRAIKDDCGRKSQPESNKDFKDEIRRWVVQRN